MPHPDTYARMTAAINPIPAARAEPPLSKHVQPSGPTTNDLLRELISEVRGLRREMRSEQLLPDTPEVRAIRAQLAKGAYDDR